MLMLSAKKGYLGMCKVSRHAVIKHQEWYVDGDVHTNTIEGFWALLKRGLLGQFHCNLRNLRKSHNSSFDLILWPSV